VDLQRTLEDAVQKGPVLVFLYVFVFTKDKHRERERERETERAYSMCKDKEGKEEQNVVRFHSYFNNNNIRSTHTHTDMTHTDM
jgi:hypothetical protein